MSTAQVRALAGVAAAQYQYKNLMDGGENGRYYGKNTALNAGAPPSSAANVNSNDNGVGY
ncbi:hypothetical protein BX616_003937, partial [Lobosporangium transversale]